MIPVELLGGRVEVELILRADRPGHTDKPVEVGSNHADLRRGRRHPLQAFGFLFGLLARLFRHRRRLDLVAPLLGFGLLGVHLSQLALDFLHLLPQKVLPLRLVYVLLNFAADPIFQLEDFDLLRQERVCQFQALDHVQRDQELTALSRLQLRHVAHEIGQPRRILDLSHRRQCVRRYVPAQIDIVGHQLLDGLHQGGDLAGFLYRL